MYDSDYIASIADQKTGGMMVSFLNRYHNGEHKKVWDELLLYGAQVYKEPLRSDALAVVYETMSRAKSNIKLLVSRLSSINYDFVYPTKVSILPKADTLNRIRELEELVGQIPMSLRVWYETVGSVCFIGNYLMLSSYAHNVFDNSITVFTDPLVVDPIEELLSEAREWLGDEGEPDFTNSCIVPISPDEYHKANISGATYNVEFPGAAIDAQLIGERHNTTFVDYLRISFQWGGFPGLDKYSQHQQPVEVIKYLTDGLLPI
ncbi:MAG: hypothetical protein HC880_06475 [Bacteroidia bacterium]|nr:hypothetical protein [Bacteroidia bacterium]